MVKHRGRGLLLKLKAGGRLQGRFHVMMSATLANSMARPESTLWQNDQATISPAQDANAHYKLVLLPDTATDTTSQRVACLVCQHPLEATKDGQIVKYVLIRRPFDRGDYKPTYFVARPR